MIVVVKMEMQEDKEEKNEWTKLRRRVIEVGVPIGLKHVGVDWRKA